jgi:D-methionine transport system substrate-binding protein
MNIKKAVIFSLAALTTTAIMLGCGNTSSDNNKPHAKPEKTEIIVGVTPGASDHIMDVVVSEAAKEGLTVTVKTFSDYVTPDQALANGDIDLNSFQHKPFLDGFNEKNGTKLVSIGNTYLAPLGLYSKKYTAVTAIPDGATIAIPNDPSNGGRALLLLQKQGLLKIKDGIASTKITIQDIAENPKNLKIVELEAAQLPRSLDDTAASVINAGYAISAGLSSKKDAIAVEDNTSPYVNIIAARPEDNDNPAYKKFVKAFQSEAVKNFITDNYNGVLVPAW